MKKHFALLIWLVSSLVLLLYLLGCSEQTAEEKAKTKADLICSVAAQRSADSTLYFKMLRQYSIFGEVVEKSLARDKNGRAVSFNVKVKQDDSIYYFSIDCSYPLTTTESGGFYQTGEGEVGYFQYGIFKELIRNRNPKKLDQMDLDYQPGSKIIILTSEPLDPNVWHYDISLCFVYSSPQEIPEPYRNLVSRTVL